MLSTQLIKPGYFVKTSHQRSTTVSLELNLQSLLPRSCQAYSHYSTIWRCQLWQTKLKLHFELKHFVLQRFKYQLSALLTIHSYYFRLENLLWNQTISLVWYFSVSFPPFTWKKFDIINRNHQGKNLLSTLKVKGSRTFPIVHAKNINSINW